MSKYQLSVKILGEYQLSFNPIQTLIKEKTVKAPEEHEMCMRLPDILSLSWPEVG